MNSNQSYINSRNHIIKTIIIIVTQTVTIIDKKIVKNLKFDENTYFQQEITHDGCILLQLDRDRSFLKYIIDKVKIQLWNFYEIAERIGVIEGFR